MNPSPLIRAKLRVRARSGPVGGYPVLGHAMGLPQASLLILYLLSLGAVVGGRHLLADSADSSRMIAVGQARNWSELASSLTTLQSAAPRVVVLLSGEIAVPATAVFNTIPVYR